MKSAPVLLVFFLLSVLFVSAAQAAEPGYASLKNAYIQDHPGQAIIPFPWEPITSARVLPFDYTIPAAPGNSFSLTACRDEFESASFVLNAQKDLSGITISVPDLYDSKGNSIPASAINVRTVKVWYQAAKDDIWYSTPQKYLAPELLLKDDSLVKVDYGTKTNYLKVTVNGVTKYTDISSPGARLPQNAQVHDAVSLQPFSLKATENKQIWLTVHVPATTPSGNYYGTIAINAPSQSPVEMTFCVRVLPFELEPAPLEYSLLYFGQLPSTPAEEQKVGIEGNWKSSEKYSAELKDMKEHGVLYPTINEWYLDDAQSETLKLALSLREQAGLPNDHIYTVGLLTGNPTGTGDLTRLKNDVAGWKRITAQYGYQDLYIYGMDEARGDVLRSERTAWKAVHAAGGKVFVALGKDNTEAVSIVGDLLDVAVAAGPLDPAQAAQWHSNGKKIFSYANPQAGVEDPEVYRRNYGFALWNAGYDGSMNFQYQHAYGESIWNDFDSASTHFRDHVFAYPTTHGVIDTIEWEGWREGVDDTRYLASLKKHEGNYTSGRAVITAALSRDDDMATIRNTIINRILVSHSAAPPTPGPAADGHVKAGIFNGVWKLDVNGNGIPEGPAIDTSFRYGAVSDDPVVGDWDGDGKDGIAIFRPSTGFWYLDYDLDGVVDKSFRYGGSTDQIIRGDWDGDGKDGIAIFRPSTGYWYFDNDLDGVPGVSFRFGGSGDQIIAGDWNGDGKDGIAIFRPSTGFWYLDYDLDGVVDKSFRYGGSTDRIIVGDWDGDGKDGIAIFRPSTGFWYFDNDLDGVPGVSFRFGGSADQILAGDWNGDGKDDIGIFRPSAGFWYLNYDMTGTVDEAFRFGATGDVAVVGDWS
jgi:hypothetical protein